MPVFSPSIRGRTVSSLRNYLVRRMTPKSLSSSCLTSSACDDPGSLWIGEIVRSGETNYNEWKKRVQSLTYLFREESTKLFDGRKVDEVFDCSKGHPILLKKHLSKELSLETMVIYDRILGIKKTLIRSYWIRCGYP